MKKPTKNDVFQNIGSTNHAWLPIRTAFLTVHGSTAYGTNGPSSDVDVKGVFIAPKNYVLGFETVTCIDKGFGDLDCAMYELREYAKLALQNNPNILELLFVDESSIIYDTPAWSELRDIRHSFLSQNVKHRYCGYAISQLKRIESHRRWLLNPPTKKPERSDYGLPETSLVPKEQREALEAMMLKVVEAWKLDLAPLDEASRIEFMNKEAEALADMKLAKDDLYVAAGNKLGLDTSAMEHLKSERAYRQALTEWNQYLTWKKERNAVRSELEAKYGFDTKHGMHLVRLLRQARELLTTGELLVRRPDAEELKAIRYNGIWSFERLHEWAKQQDVELEALMATSVLPKRPDYHKVQQVVMNLGEKYLQRSVLSWEENFYLGSRW